MTVSTTENVIEYVDGGPDFPIPYRFLRDEDIQVELTTPNGLTETLSAAQYSLVGAGSAGGGTMSSAYASGVLAVGGAILTVSRIMAPLQPIDLRNQGRYLAETQETGLDRLTMLIQQGINIASRALRRPVGKNYYDAQGRQIKNLGAPTEPQDATTKGYVDYADSEISSRVDALSAGLPGTNYAFPWSTITTQSTKVLTPGFTFASATLAINGQTQSYGRAYVVVNNTIVLAEAIPAGVEVSAVLGQSVVPSDLALKSDLAGQSGSSLIGFRQADAASVPMTVESKLRLATIAVEDFGAVDSLTGDSAAAFQAAVNSLPASGGVISARGATYRVDTAPNVGAKSIYWDFGPNTLITGAQTTFPRFATNGDCRPNGPYIRSQAAGPTIDGAASFGLAIESIQPATDTNNGYGALFLGAQLNADGVYSITSAFNAVATANPGSSGNIFGGEIDVATFADPGKGTQFGLLISGAGGNDITFGIRINRHGTAEKYLYGIAMVSARIGMFVDDSQGGLENGLVLGNPPARYGNNMIQAMQISNGGGVLLMQRKTNTSPTGNFISAINANNTQQLFAVDINGNVIAQRLEAPTARLTGAPVAQSAGQVAIGAQTSASASAGGIAPPAQVAGYLVMYIGATQFKVPYYAA